MMTASKASSNPAPFILDPTWYEIKHWAEWDAEFYGAPLFIEEIQYTGKRWLGTDDKYSYGYRVIIRRPGEDNGSGIVYLGDIPFRILYWAGEAERLLSDFIPSVYGYETYQDWNPNKPRQLILYFKDTFPPGKYSMKIAPLPYPSSHGSTLAKYVKLVRSDEASYLSGAWDFFYGGMSFVRNLKNMAGGKALDVAIDTFMIEGANKYGVSFMLEIPAFMPDIHDMDARVANKELFRSGLNPAPGTCVQPPHQGLQGKVFKERYAAGYSLNANTNVPYKYYCYKSKTSQSPQPSPPSGVNSSKDKSYIKIRLPRGANMCEDSTVRIRIDNFDYGIVPKQSWMSIDLSGLRKHEKHTMYITGMPSGKSCSYFKSHEIYTTIEISVKGNIVVDDEEGRTVAHISSGGSTNIPGNETKQFNLKIYNKNEYH